MYGITRQASWGVKMTRMQDQDQEHDGIGVGVSSILSPPALNKILCSTQLAPFCSCNFLDRVYIPIMLLCTYHYCLQLDKKWKDGEVEDVGAHSAHALLTYLATDRHATCA